MLTSISAHNKVRSFIYTHSHSHAHTHTHTSVSAKKSSKIKQKKKFKNIYSKYLSELLEQTQLNSKSNSNNSSAAAT